MPTSRLPPDSSLLVLIFVAISVAGRTTMLPCTVVFFRDMASSSPDFNLVCSILLSVVSAALATSIL
jgi:spore maturation protein SpmA